MTKKDGNSDGWLLLISLIICFLVITFFGLIYGIFMGAYLAPTIIGIYLVLNTIVELIHFLRTEETGVIIKAALLRMVYFSKYLLYITIIATWIWILFFLKEKNDKMLIQVLIFAMYEMYLYPALMFIEAHKTGCGIFSIFGYITLPLSIAIFAIVYGQNNDLDYLPLLVPTISGLGYLIVESIYRYKVKKGLEFKIKKLPIKYFFYIIGGLMVLLAFILTIIAEINK